MPAPEELPLPVELPLVPAEPLVPEAGELVLGVPRPPGVLVLGEVLDEPDELPIPEDELPPLLELEPDLLKCASHSEREIEPSLLVSTDEKLGVDMLLPEVLELGDVELDEPPAAPVELLPVDELPLAEGEDELPELDFLSSAALAASDRAKSAAAVVTVTVFNISALLGVVRKAPYPSQGACRARGLRYDFGVVQLKQGDAMSKRSEAMKRKAKSKLKKARVQLARFKARARVEMARHARAFKLAAKRYKVALKNS